LSPLLVLIYINGISDEVQNCMLYLYADDCSIFCQVDPHSNPAVAHDLIQSDLNRLTLWATLCKLDFKAIKIKEVIFRSPRHHAGNHAPLLLNNAIINRGISHKHLGITLDENLNVNEHLTNVITKCNIMLNPLKALKTSVQSKHLERMIHHLCFPIWNTGPFCLIRQVKIYLPNLIEYTTEQR
jgi:hypothetical protein